MASMSDRAPTPHGTRAVPDEAAAQADRLRQADDRYRLVLLLLAAISAAVGLLVAIPRAEPLAINLRLGIPALLATGLVAAVLLLLRMPASSRWGRGWFLWSVAAFSIWNGVVISVSTSTGWLGPGEPGPHFAISAVVAAIPLVAGAWLIGWRRH